MDKLNKKISPHVMPVDREKWFNSLSHSNFINSAYQYRDIQTLGNINTILEIGSGQGLSTQILRQRGYEVTTYDIDTLFKPDFQGSVHDMSVFKSKEFDVTIASHVLEHLPIQLLESSLHEISRVSKYALVYLPVAGTHHMQFRFMPGIRRIDFNIYLDFYNYLEQPSGEDAKYCQGQHYWELGYRGFKKKDMMVYFKKYFKILSHYRNKDWNSSYNFILQSVK